MNYTRTSGIAVMDFRALPGDGTSSAWYRFGLASGSTGVNGITLYEPNGSTQSARFASGSFHSYVNAQGGNFGLGTSSPEALLHVTGDGDYTTGNDDGLHQHVSFI